MFHLYVSTYNPLKNLKDLVKIVTLLYAPGKFYIKSHANVTLSAQNFWYVLSSSKKLKVEYQTIVIDSLNKNAFFHIQTTF